MTEYKYIDYFGTTIGVSKNGDIVWNGKRRNITYNADGYSVCSIKVPNKGWRSVRVSRLVALAYIPNPNNLPEVNHKDFDRTNSNVENLEWVSRRDNVRYSICNKPDMHGENNPNYGNNKLSKIYANDKELAKEKQIPKIKVLSVGELLGHGILRILSDEPLSGLFTYSYDKSKRELL